VVVTPPPFPASEDEPASALNALLTGNLPPATTTPTPRRSVLFSFSLSLVAKEEEEEEEEEEKVASEPQLLGVPPQ
jgi:hypothetical protein